MAKKVVADRGVCIRVACLAFRISESCYRYERKLDAENNEVATWLIRLTDNHRNWGFGLCYLRQRLQMEPQACVPYLQGVGAQFTDQAAQTAGAREPGSLDGAARNQPSLVDGLHARPAGRWHNI